jgi:hypothetical protein
VARVITRARTGRQIEARGSDQNLLFADQIDRDMPGGACDAGGAVVVSVAPDCFEQKKKLLGKHGGSPFTSDVANDHRKLSWRTVGACDPDHVSNAVFDWVNKE